MAGVRGIGSLIPAMKTILGSRMNPQCVRTPHFGSASGNQALRHKDHTQNKKNVSNWYSANKSLLQTACILMFSSMIFTYVLVLPACDRINAKRASRDEFLQHVIDESEKMHDVLEQHRKSLKRCIEAQTAQPSGNSKENCGESVQFPGNTKEHGGVGDV